MKKHQQVTKSFTVYISNGRREDVHWVYSKYFYTLSQRTRPIGQQAEWQPPPHLGRQEKPYRFQANPVEAEAEAEARLSRKLSLFSERLGLPASLGWLPGANPLRPGIPRVGKRTKNACVFSQLQKSPTLEMITNWIVRWFEEKGRGDEHKAAVSRRMGGGSM